jgi:hypothetical protein
LALILTSLPSVELAENGDSLNIGSPFLVDILIAYTVNSITLVTLRDFFESFFSLEFSESAIDEVFYLSEVMLYEVVCTSKGSR